MAKHKLIRNSKPNNDKTEDEIHYVQRTLALVIKREREKSAEALDLSKRCAAHAQHTSRALTAFTRLVKKGALGKTLAATAAVVMACASITGAQAGDDKRHCRRARQHNYIVERQLNYQVPSGSMPTDRLIIGRRQIDVYSDGSMFEGDHMVGVRK